MHLVVRPGRFESPALPDAVDLTFRNTTAGPIEQAALEQSEPDGDAESRPVALGRTTFNDVMAPRAAVVAALRHGILERLRNPIHEQESIELAWDSTGISRREPVALDDPKLPEGETVVGLRGGEPLLLVRLPAADEEGMRHVPSLALPEELSELHRRAVLSAAVRAGARPPGLRAADLRSLHAAAVRGPHLELFSDLNSLTTGLLQRLVHDLGRRCARVVVASTSIDVLHESLATLRSGATESDRLRRAHMRRALSVLDELRSRVPVHVHQLPPGASRYFRRGASGAREELTEEEGTYVAEDRQMISAYWDYVATAVPRVPVVFVTSDFALAHVCQAERVQFLFARHPLEEWKRSNSPLQTFWFDPNRLRFRHVTSQQVLWELCLAFGELELARPDGKKDVLRHEPKEHTPGEAPEVKVARLAPASPTPIADRGLTVAATAVLGVLPRSLTDSRPLSEFQPRGADAVRQLRYVGDATGLYVVVDDVVRAGPRLPELLEALDRQDYEAVNGLFRVIPRYAAGLDEAAERGVFARGSHAGAVTGWAITLGAAYKQAGLVSFGLAPCTDEDFRQAVVDAHARLGAGQAAVPLPDVLHAVCVQRSLSPVRFQAMLRRNLTLGVLAPFQLNFATVAVPYPAHTVLVRPSAEPDAGYMRTMEPGRGIDLGNGFVSSLVNTGTVSS